MPRVPSPPSSPREPFISLRPLASARANTPSLRTSSSRRTTTATSTSRPAVAPASLLLAALCVWAGGFGMGSSLGGSIYVLGGSPPWAACRSARLEEASSTL